MVTLYTVTLSLTYIWQRPPDVSEPLPDLAALRQVDQDEGPQRPRPAVVLEADLVEHRAHGDVEHGEQDDRHRHDVLRVAPEPLSPREGQLVQEAEEEEGHAEELHGDGDPKRQRESVLG